jgi:hypothetical protein
MERIETPMGSGFGSRLEPRSRTDGRLRSTSRGRRRASGRAPPRAERVEVGREAPDEVEHDLLDPLRVLGEDLEHDIASTASVPSWTPAS